MAFEFFRAISPLEIKVRPRRAGETLLCGYSRDDGDWVISYSSPRVCATMPLTRKRMIEEIEAAGFEYAPWKRVYRRGCSFVARKG